MEERGLHWLFTRVFTMALYPALSHPPSVHNKPMALPEHTGRCTNLTFALFSITYWLYRRPCYGRLCTALAVLKDLFLCNTLEELNSHLYPRAAAGFRKTITTYLSTTRSSHNSASPSLNRAVAIHPITPKFIPEVNRWTQSRNGLRSREHKLGRGYKLACTATGHRSNVKAKNLAVERASRGRRHVSRLL